MYTLSGEVGLSADGQRRVGGQVRAVTVLLVPWEVGCQMAGPWLAACYRALPLSMLINPNQRAVSVTPRSARDAPTGLILL